MIEAGEVGAIFRVVDEASGPLKVIAEQFERLDAVMKPIKDSLRSLALPPRLAAQLRALNESFASVGGAADKAAAGVGSAFGKVDASVNAAIDRVGVLKGEMASLGRISADTASIKATTAAALRPLAAGPAVRLPPAPEGLPPGGAFRGHDGGGHGGGFRLGGGIPIDAPGGGHMHMSAGGPGFWTLLTGLALGEATKKFLEDAFALRHQMVMVKSATTDAAIQAAVLGKAWQEAGSNVNSTVVDNIKNIMELNKATGNWTESMKLLHTFNVAEAALGSVKDQKLKETMADSSQTLNFARGLEELGATSRGKTPEARDAETKQYAADLIRTMIWSRGRFDGNMLFGATNNSGGMAQNWDERFATTIAPIMALEMKGSKFGNMDYMAIKSLVGGHITSSNVAALLKNKLITKDETYTDKFGMHLKPNSPDMIKLMTNPWDWANDELAAMRKRGVDTGSQKVMADLVTELANSKTLSTGLRMLLEPAAHALIAKDIAMRDLVPPDAASVLMGQDPGQIIGAVGAKWNDLMASLGGPITDKALAGLSGLANALSGMAQFFDHHPTAAKLAADTTADAAGVLTVGGALMMTKFVKNAFGWLKGGAADAAASAAGGGGILGGLRGGAIGLGIDVVGHQLMDALLTPPQQYQLRDAFPGMWPITDLFFREPEDRPWFTLKGGLFDYPSTGGAGPANRQTRDALPYLRNQNLQGIGAEFRLPPMVPEITGALNTLPGQVQPAISNTFSQIGAAMASAISRMVAQANAAAGALPTAGKTVVVHTAVNLDGRKVAQIVTTHQMADQRTVSSTGRFDGSSMATPTDYSIT